MTWTYVSGVHTLHDIVRHRPTPMSYDVVRSVNTALGYIVSGPIKSCYVVRNQNDYKLLLLTSTTNHATK